MTKVYSKALNEEIQIDRIIGQISGMNPGPTIIFTGGIHGNEPSGVFALKNIFDKLTQKERTINGTIYGIAGNLKALGRGDRYEKHDLNRLWTAPRMKKLVKDEIDQLGDDGDTQEQLEIYRILKGILEQEKGPFFFIDLHTTSSHTTPFMTVNDTTLNRNFALQYPVPTILGIEEFLEGPLLSHVNYLGYIAIGFESGQHDDVCSILNHESFIYLTLINSGTLEKDKFSDYQFHFDRLSTASKNVRQIFEITHRHEIHAEDEFQMNPGLQNFQPLKKNVKVALSNDRPVYSPKKGRMFMPLYQKQGNDGYFIVREIPKFALRLSSFLRKAKVDSILVLLPGVRWANKKKKTLVIRLSVARFMAKQLFHLLGYRSKQVDNNYMYAKKREASMRTEEYRELSKAWKT